MNARVRNRLTVFGLLWGLALASFPAVFAFNDPFTLSPFLVAAFSCSALSGAAGMLLAGRWASGSGEMSRSGRPGVLITVSAGVLQGVVSCVLATLSIWFFLAVNISGFSAARPGAISNLVTSPGIFEMSGIAAQAIFVYSLVAGLLLSPVSGSLLLWMARGDRPMSHPPQSRVAGISHRKGDT